MSLIRIPVIDVDQLQVLRSLLRLDFTRATTKALKENHDITSQCVVILQLVETMSFAERPLVLTEALMQVRGISNATLPLRPDLFGFYTKLLDIALNDEGFPGLTADELESVLAPVRNCVQELKTIFKESGHVDSELTSKTDTTTTPSGMMN